MNDSGHRQQRSVYLTNNYITGNSILTSCSGNANLLISTKDLGKIEMISHVLLVDQCNGLICPTINPQSLAYPRVKDNVNFPAELKRSSRVKWGQSAKTRLRRSLRAISEEECWVGVEKVVHRRRLCDLVANLIFRIFFSF